MLTFKPQFVGPIDQDKLLIDAIKYVVKIKMASASLLQRQFRIGFAMAGNLLDKLEEAKIVSPADGARPRKVLIDSIDDLDLDKASQKDEKILEPIILKWQKTVNLVKGFKINLGKDEKGDLVSIDIEKYGNLILVGSQMTNISNLVNNIILDKVKEKSPEELRLIIIDGFINQIDLPIGAPHLLTPIVKQPEMIEATLRWIQLEIEHRLSRNNGENNPDILLVINGYNESFFGFGNTDYLLNRVLTRGKSIGIYTLITFDYLAPNTNKTILANNGAKVVFRPTTKQMARSSGIPESIKLESPDMAILETMFEGKTKFTIDKFDIKKMYDEIFST